MNSHRTLVLNQSREFLGVVDCKNAICDIVTGKVHVLENYDKTISSPSITMHLPAVVCEKEYKKVNFKHLIGVSYSKRNVFLRDEFVCQYCGNSTSRKKYSTGAMKKNSKLYKIVPTIDHIVPQSKGGGSTWENTVTSCYSCNRFKRDSSLEKSGLKLARIPTKPRGFRNIVRIKIGQVHDLWEKYLYDF